MREIRTVRKWVSIETEVEVSPFDLLKTLTREELLRECEDRGIELRPREEQRFHHVHEDALDEIHHRLEHRQFEDFFLLLERELPRQFRGMTTTLMRHFRKGAMV